MRIFAAMFVVLLLSESLKAQQRVANSEPAGHNSEIVGTYVAVVNSEYCYSYLAQECSGGSMLKVSMIEDRIYLTTGYLNGANAAKMANSNTLTFDDIDPKTILNPPVTMTISRNTVTAETPIWNYTFILSPGGKLLRGEAVHKIKKFKVILSIQEQRLR